MGKLMNKLFGSHSDREIKRFMPIVDKIEALEEDYKKLSDSELKNKTIEFKERLAGEETLDDILPEAFATVREASFRVLGMRHYKVQLIGGIVLHQGRISEMKTGEGKTLVATLPAYLNALTGEGVHIVTVNDYLAKRDSEWMGKVYNFLGLTVGLIIHGVEGDDKQEAYNRDITYGTNNEFGFDYLRDNMVIYKEQMVQRGHVFAIVDEVDSILIDEARTPLIISGEGTQSTKMYQIADSFARKLKMAKVLELDSKELSDEMDGDYVLDEKGKNINLTAEGVRKAEQFFGLPNLMEPENAEINHHIIQAIKAYAIFHKDVEYVVKDGEIIIVDEFTGRLMFGRRYSDGLHQAIEAKEKVNVQKESKTLATITFQNYFRLYNKLSGMTGTALTEEMEFRQIYGLDVIEIPTNKPLARVDFADSVYKSEAGKLRAVIKQIEECAQKGQPVLVGTVSIEKSEYLSDQLKKIGLKHVVLNAKHHEEEAEIVAQAGKPAAITIATNMAGRGTDIMLGGNAEYITKAELGKRGYSDYLISESNGFSDTDNGEIIEIRKLYNELYSEHKNQIEVEAKKVTDAGGLFIIGTERHESRRIDNQLRGRAGRQGDPGGSRFYLSMEDELMRLFGGDRVLSVISALGLDEDTPIEAGILSNTIESAQRKVEGRNFDIRKHVLQYDDVMNKQREVIYQQRKKVLDGENLKDYILKMTEEVIETSVDFACTDENRPDEYNFGYLKERFGNVFVNPKDLDFSIDQLNRLSRQALKDMLKEAANKVYDQKEQAIGEVMREVERVVLLRSVDTKWMDHIDAMDDLKRNVSMRGYAQRDPVVEYKFEGFSMFEQMIDEIKTDTVRSVFTAQIRGDEPKREQVAVVTGASASDETVKKEPKKRDENKVGRNDPCPCGSGKKYKVCCGK